MTRFRSLPVLVAATALCFGCGSSSNDSANAPEAAPAPEATVHSVKMGMTKAQVTKLLGQPDEINELYGLEDVFVDWLWDLDGSGRQSVTFSKSGEVTRVHYCPNAVCEYVRTKEGL